MTEDPKAPKTRVTLNDAAMATLHEDSDRIELDYRITLPFGFHSVTHEHVCIAGVRKGDRVYGEVPGFISLEELRVLVASARGGKACKET